MSRSKKPSIHRSNRETFFFVKSPHHIIIKLPPLHVCWVFPLRVNDLIFGWWIQGQEGLSRRIWYFLPRVICWTIWKERHTKTFDDTYVPFDRICLTAYRLLFDLVSILDDFVESDQDGLWSVILQSLWVGCWFVFLFVSFLSSSSQFTLLGT